MGDPSPVRHSSRLKQKAVVPPVPREEEDELAAELLAVVMARIRQVRDDTERQLARDMELSGGTVELMREVVTTKMERIDNTVSNLENNVAGTQLETLLRDPLYGSPIKSKPVSPIKQKAVVPTTTPAEVKEEEASVAATPSSSTAPETTTSTTAAAAALTVNTAASSQAGPDTVEKAAKQEAHTMARIAELRRAGMWSSSRLPLCVEPPRNKTHWDYVLEEVRWMANDFKQERTWKRGAARKIARTIANQRREKEAEAEKAQARALRDEKRACATIAKMVREFWQNVDKVVDHKKQSIIEQKKRKALDQHLQFIVGEADKLSQVVAEGIVADTGSKTPSVKDDDANDKDFSEGESETDDETTIAKADQQLKKEDVTGELDDLGKEADMDMDAFLESLPPEYLASLGYAVPSTSKAEPKEEEEEKSGEDEDMDSDDEPLVKAMPKRGSLDKGEIKVKGGKGKGKALVEEEDEEEGREDSDDEPLAKKMKKKIAEPEEESDDDEPLAEKIRRSREATAESRETEGQKGGGDEKTEGEPSTPSPSDEKVKLENVDYAKLKSTNSDERQLELTHIAEEALKFQPKGYTLETTQVKTAVPHLIRGTLREYQMVGLDWLVTLYDKNLNGILADEMGLGKTIQTVALLAHLACQERIWGPHLIVVPTSVILNWEMELKKWCPALKVLTYFGSVKERAEKRKGWLKPNSFHVCITSYKVVTTDIRSFKMRPWQYLILDEAQNIKNWKSQRWQMLLNVRARRRLLLTGTPLQNSLMELWSLLHFLMPAIFASHDDFKDWFSNPLTGMMEGSIEFNKGLLDRLHKVLRPFILRRMKSEVEKQLPEKTEHVVKCPLSKRQRYLYEDFMSQRQTRENLKSGNMMSVLNIVMQLRKCCNHPNLFAPREEQTPLVVPRVTRVFPAMIFDLVTAEPSDAPDIPDCLDLRKRMVGWRSNIKSRKPLIEELEDAEAEPRPPKLPGFKFVRPIPGRAPPSRPPPGEMFLVVEGDSDIGGLLKERVQVTVDGGKVLLNKEGKVVGAEGLRVCQAVPGGSFRDVSSDPPPSANGTSATSRTSSAWPSASGGGGAPVSLPPAASESRRNSAAASGMTRRSGGQGHVTFRTTTQLHAQPSTSTATSSGSTTGGPLQNGGANDDGGPSGEGSRPDRRRGIHALMQQGACEPLDRAPLPLSPPAKRRRVARPLVSGPYKELVPDHTLAGLEADRIARLERALSRFVDDERRQPMYSWQLMATLWRETRIRVPGKKDEWRHTFWLAEREDIQERLRAEQEEVVKRFVVYVDGALTESPRVVASSTGRSAFARATHITIQEEARSLLNECNPLVSQCLLGHRLQFPELRLIEYDCGKLQVLAKLLRELYVYKHRCLIFTQMSRMLDVLQAFLSHHSYQYFRLDGTTPIEQRQAMMERFNADARIFCFILSTRSGGVGVNLTGADTVIFYDSDWNPTMDAQAQDRCHRIGQTRNVSIYRLISERTIEENILKKATQKRRLGEMAIDEAGFTPAFFHEKDNIRDLFEGENLDDSDVAAPVDAPTNERELENAMATLEDEQDVVAAKAVAREAKADRNEFDERLAGGYGGPGVGRKSPDEPVDEQFEELLCQLKPIERYAISFLEAEYKPDFEEEVKEAEALIVQKKAEWDRAHERAMRDEADADADPLLSSAALSLDEARISGLSASARRRRAAPPPRPHAEPARHSSRIHEHAIVQSAKRRALMLSPRLSGSGGLGSGALSASASAPRRPPLDRATTNAVRAALQKAKRGRGRPRKIVFGGETEEEEEEEKVGVNGREEKGKKGRTSGGGDEGGGVTRKELIDSALKRRGRGRPPKRPEGGADVSASATSRMDRPSTSSYGSSSSLPPPPRPPLAGSATLHPVSTSRPAYSRLPAVALLSPTSAPQPSSSSPYGSPSRPPGSLVSSPSSHHQYGHHNSHSHQHPSHQSSVRRYVRTSTAASRGVDADHHYTPTIPRPPIGPATRTPLTAAQRIAAAARTSQGSSGGPPLPVRVLQASPAAPLRAAGGGAARLSASSAPSASPYRLPVRVVHSQPLGTAASRMNANAGGGSGGGGAPTRYVIVRSSDGGSGGGAGGQQRVLMPLQGGRGQGRIVFVRRGGGTMQGSGGGGGGQGGRIVMGQRPSLGEYDRPRLNLRVRGASAEEEEPTTSTSSARGAD